MLEASGFPDTTLTAHMSEGFRLSGWLGNTGLFPKDVRPPQYDLRTLQLMTKGLNKSIMAQLAESDDSDPVVIGTCEKTQSEVENGFIWEDVGSSCGEKVLAKRFGLTQRGGKLRVIDECSIGGLNGALGTVERYRIQGIDECAAYFAWCLDYCHERGLDVQLVGRTFDLISAYKQYGVHITDRSLLRLAVRDPHTHSIKFFGVNSLPFGASGAVGSFLRISLESLEAGRKIF